MTVGQLGRQGAIEIEPQGIVLPAAMGESPAEYHFYVVGPQVAVPLAVEPGQARVNIEVGPAKLVSSSPDRRRMDPQGGVRGPADKAIADFLGALAGGVARCVT